MALLAFNSCGVGKRLQSAGILADDSGRGGLASNSLSPHGPQQKHGWPWPNSGDLRTQAVAASS